MSIFDRWASVLRAFWRKPDPPMPTRFRRVPRRGPCPICGRDVAWTQIGNMYRHTCVAPKPVGLQFHPDAIRMAMAPLDDAEKTDDKAL